MVGRDHQDGGTDDHTACANALRLTVALPLTGSFLVAAIAGGLSSADRHRVCLRRGAWAGRG